MLQKHASRNLLWFNTSKMSKISEQLRPDGTRRGVGTLWSLEPTAVLGFHRDREASRTPQLYHPLDTPLQLKLPMSIVIQEHRVYIILLSFGDCRHNTKMASDINSFSAIKDLFQGLHRFLHPQSNICQEQSLTLLMDVSRNVSTVQSIGPWPLFLLWSNWYLGTAYPDIFPLREYALLKVRTNECVLVLSVLVRPRNDFPCTLLVLPWPNL